MPHLSDAGRRSKGAGMTASPPHAADCRDGKRDYKPFPGHERSRTAAHSLILRNPADVVRTTPRIAVYRISAGWRAGDSYCRLSLKGVTARNLETNLPAPFSHRAAALDPCSVIRRDLLPATVFAGASSVVGSASAPLRHFLLNFSGPLARWSFPLRIQPRKQSRCGLSKCFRSFSSALCHGDHHDRRTRQSAVKE